MNRAVAVDAGRSGPPPSPSSSPIPPPPPLEWKFSQVFGERTAGEDVQEVDIISAIEFDKSGDHLATGDRGGRVVLFERTDARPHGSRQDLEKKDCAISRHPEFRYKTEFQSHEPEFDYLKSLEIEEKINKIRWCQSVGDALFLLSTNDKTIKYWKVQEKKIKQVSEMNIDTSHVVGNGVGASSSTNNFRTYLPNGCSGKPYNYLGEEFSFPPGGFPSLHLPVTEVSRSISKRRGKRRRIESSMASFSRVLLVVLSLLLFFSFDFTTAAPSKKPSSSARREDVPFIKCQVCERIAHQIHSQVQKKEAQTGPKKVSEFEIIEIAENVCNLKKEQADWILQIDIVEKGDKLKLVDQETEGQCNSECKTIERACQEVMGYADTDVAEFFFKTNPSVDSLVKFLCYDLSKACSVPPPPVPKDRIPGEPFLAKPSKDAEMEKILRSMQDMPGAPSMKMYSREDLLNNNFGGEDADEDVDEDEDDFPTKLGEALKHKGPSNQDLKGKLLKGIKETGKRMKQHLSKVSQTVKKWWRGKKSSPKSKKSSKAEL